eukprot:scaffold12113_cov159-Amphora_coffeaeformis.AAC.2
MTNQVTQKVNNELRTLQFKCLTKQARAEELKTTAAKIMGRMALSFATLGFSKVWAIPKSMVDRSERRQTLKDLVLLEFHLAETYYTYVDRYGSEGVFHVNSAVLMSRTKWSQARNSLVYKLKEMVRDGRLAFQHAGEDIVGLGNLVWTSSNLFELFSEHVLGQEYESMKEILWDEVTESGGDEFLEELAETFLDILVS